MDTEASPVARGSHVLAMPRDHGPIRDLMTIAALSYLPA
jgi:hypothetical protein